jgi:hypothetical protein
MFTTQGKMIPLNEAEKLEIKAMEKIPAAVCKVAICLSAA